jgi:predicted kinase
MTDKDLKKELKGQEIILCIGLPASGKSTWAKEFCINNPTFVRINKDDIRDLLGSPVFNHKFENSVLDIQRRMGLAVLDTGKSLIVDDTNFAPKHETYWGIIATTRGIGLGTMFFDTPVEECIERDSKREKPVGKAVIMDMYKKYIQSKN